MGHEGRLLSGARTTAKQLVVVAVIATAVIALTGATVSADEAEWTFTEYESPDRNSFIGPWVDQSGDLVAVAAPRGAYIFEADDSGQQVATALAPSDGAPDLLFGSRIAVDGDRAIVSAIDPLSITDPTVGVSAVYVYERQGLGDWVETAILRPSDPAEENEFGYDIDVDGDLIVVGAWGAPRRGAVYIFEPDGSGDWSETKLVPDDPGLDMFGLAVAADGGRVVASSIGDSRGAAVFVYESDGDGGWTYERLSVGLDFRSNFGFSVAIDGDRLAVGANADTGGGYGGSVYVFDFDGDEWTPTKLTLDDGTFGRRLGSGVAVDGDRVWARGSDGSPLVLFERSPDGWLGSVPITDTATRHGEQVAAGNGTVLVAARRSSDGSAVARLYRHVPIDSDGDGVPDTNDRCPGTELPDSGIESVKRNRYLADDTGDFVDGRGRRSDWSVADTGGCSGEQIIDEAGLGDGHRRHGLSRGELRSWIADLDR